MAGLAICALKSAINRAPRQKTAGRPGERFSLQLELKVLADVGLLGMPNAGKSTFITAVSNARPKIADYPFTTLHPNLGVVRVAPEQSFVVADIPGLIEGASEGAGLGHQFLRHLQRTRLLLHIVDLAPFDEGVDPVQQAKAIVGELKKYDAQLFSKPRWLVLNKIDMMPRGRTRRAGCKILSSALNGKARCLKSPPWRAKALICWPKPLTSMCAKSSKSRTPDPANIDPRFVPDESDPRFASGCLRTCSRSKAARTKS